MAQASYSKGSRILPRGFRKWGAIIAVSLFLIYLMGLSGADRSFTFIQGITLPLAVLCVLGLIGCSIFYLAGPSTNAGEIAICVVIVAITFIWLAIAWIAYGWTHYVDFGVRFNIGAK